MSWEVVKEPYVLSCEKAVEHAAFPICFSFLTFLLPHAKIPAVVAVLWHFRTPDASLTGAVLATSILAIMSKIKFPTFQPPLGHESLDERRGS